MITSLINKHKQVLLYSILGGMGAAADFLVFGLLVHILHLMPVLATAISTSTGIITSFLLNNKYNFKKHDQLLYRFITFFVIGCFGLLLSVAIIFIFFNAYSLPALLAKLISIPPVVYAQFLLNKRVSFSDNPQHFWRKIVSLPNIGMDKIKKDKYFALFVFSSLASLAYGLLICRNWWFSDEDDNILGGILINHDRLPYVDFFSHHAPLTYYVSAIFTAVTHANISLFRTLWFVLLFLGCFVVSIYIYRNIAKLGAACFLVLSSLFTVKISTNAFLAESLIAPLALFTVLLTIYGKSVRRNICLIFVMGVIVGLLNPIYSLIFISCFVYIALRERFTLKELLLFIGSVIFVVTCGVAFMLQPIGRGFMTDYYTFNSLYYAPFNGEAGSIVGILDAPLRFLGSLAAHNWSVEQITSFYGAIFISWILAMVFALSKKRYGLALLIFGVASYTQIRAFSYLPTYTFWNQHGILWRFIGLGLFSVVTPSLLKTMLLWLRQKSATHAIIGFTTIALTLVCMFGLFNALCSTAYSDVGVAKHSRQDEVINNRKVIGTSERILSLLEPNQTFWAGPLRFEMYYDHPLQSASRYYFFLPWHAKCDSCSREFYQDLAQKKPALIYWEDTEISGVDTHVYAPNMYTFLHDNYIVSTDPRLKGYYFKSTALMHAAEEKING